MCPNAGCPAWGKHRKVPPAGSSFFNRLRRTLWKTCARPACCGRKNRLGGENRSKSHCKTGQKPEYSRRGRCKLCLSATKRRRPAAAGNGACKMKRFTAFIREKGFYLALLACILAAAASSVWAIRTVVGRLNGTAESQSSPGIAGGAQRRGCAHRAERIARVLPVLLAGGYLFFAFRRAGRLWAAGRLAGSLLCLAGAWADARALQRG